MIKQKNQQKLTLVVEVLVLIAAEFVCVWVFVVSAGVELVVVLVLFVTWSAGNDSGTVWSVVLIVVDIFK